MRPVTRYLVITAFIAAATVVNFACDERTYIQGEAIYEYKCANCHMSSGEGLLGNIPPLAGADWLERRRGDIACIIRYGYRDSITVNSIRYGAPMAGHPELSDTEITNVANYILTAWYNTYEPLTPGEVSEALETCSDWEKVTLAPGVDTLLLKLQLQD